MDKNKKSEVNFLIRKSINDLKYLKNKKDILNPESMDIIQSIRYDLKHIIEIYLVD